MVDVPKPTVRLLQTDSAFDANQQCACDKRTVRLTQTDSAFGANGQCVYRKGTVRLHQCTMEYNAKGLAVSIRGGYKTLTRGRNRCPGIPTIGWHVSLEEK